MRDPRDSRPLSASQVNNEKHALNYRETASKMQPGQMSPWMEAVLNGRIDARDSPRTIAQKIAHNSTDNKGKSPKNGTETDKLLATIQKMGNKAELYGGKTHNQPGRSTFHKIMDVLSAPGNAVTSAIWEADRNAANHKNDNIFEQLGGVAQGIATGVGHGLKSGVTGKGAHHFGDIRNQAGIDFGRIGNAALDFIGGAALDPLMYVGLSELKLGAKAAVEGATHAPSAINATGRIGETSQRVAHNFNPAATGIDRIGATSRTVAGGQKPADIVAETIKTGKAPRKQVSAASSKPPKNMVTARVDDVHVKTDPATYAHLPSSFFEDKLFDLLPEHLIGKFLGNVDQSIAHAMKMPLRDALREATPAVIRLANEHAFDATLKHLRLTAKTEPEKKLLAKLEKAVAKPEAKAAPKPRAPKAETPAPAPVAPNPADSPALKEAKSQLDAARKVGDSYDVAHFEEEVAKLEAKAPVADPLAARRASDSAAWEAEWQTKNRPVNPEAAYTKKNPPFKWEPGKVPQNRAEHIEYQLAEYWDAIPKAGRKKLLDEYESLTNPAAIAERAANAAKAKEVIAKAAETVDTPVEQEAIKRAANVAAEDKAKLVDAAKGDDLRAVTHKQKIDKFDPADDIIDEVISNTKYGIDIAAFKRGDFNLAKQVNLYNAIRDRIIETRAAVEIKGSVKTTRGNVLRARLRNKPFGETAQRIDGVALATLKAAEDRLLALGHPGVHFDGTPIRLSDVIANLEHGVSHKEDYFTQLQRAKNGRYTSPRLQQAVANAAEASRLDEGAQLSGAVRGIIDAVEAAKPDTADVATTLRDALATGKPAAQAAEEMGMSPAGQKAAAQTLKEADAVDPMQRVLDDTAARVPEAVTAGGGKKPPTATIRTVADNTIKRAESTERAIGILVGFGARHRWAEIPLFKLKGDPRRIVLASKVAAAEEDARKAGIKGSREYRAIIESQLSRIERTEDFFRVRFQSSYGVNTQVHGLVTGAEGGARSLAHASANKLNKMAVAFGRKNLNDAVRVAAKGGERPVLNKATGETLDLGKYMENYLSNMFGKGGVTGRETITKDELNHELLRIFPNGKYEFKGSGDTWRESWRDIFADPALKDPIQLIPAFEQAVQGVLLRKHTFEHVSSLWGIKAGEDIPAGYRTLTTKAIDPLQREGMHFPPDLAEQLDRAFNAATQTINAPNALVKHLDNIMGYWKAGVTIYNPAFHIRNMEGDIFMGWLDGVKTTSYYKGARVLRAGSQERGSFFSDFVGNMADTAPRTGKIKLKRAIEYRGRMVTELPDTVVHDLFLQHGLRQEISVAEQLSHGRDLVAGADEIATNLAQRGSNIVRNMSERREDLGRVAHFIDRLERSTAGSLDEMAAEAAHYTRKFHFDYNDLTEFEKKIMRRIVPFYTWQRKSIPLLMEQTLMQPGRMNLYPKAAQMVSQALGFDVNEDNPFPSADNIMPAWMQATMMFPVHQNANGNFVYAEPSTPFNDMWEKTLGGPATESPINSLFTNQMSSVNPAIRIPFELTRGKNYFGNTPISDKSQYVSSQIPIVSTAGRLLNVDPVGTVMGQGDPIARSKSNYGQYADEKGLNGPAIINFMTALGLNENTERKRRSELRRQQDILEVDRNKAKTDFWKKQFGYAPPKGK